MEQNISTLKVFRISRMRVALSFFITFVLSLPVLYIIALLTNNGDIVLFSFMVFAIAPASIPIQSEIKKIILSKNAISGHTILWKKPFFFSFHKKGFKLSSIKKIIKKGIIFKRLLIYSEEGEKVIIESSLFSRKDLNEIMIRLESVKHLTI